VVVWRFEGTWQHRYTGEVGEQSERHTSNQREVFDAEGNMEHVADGTTARMSMRWRAVDGELHDDFDVVVADGDIPEPPGPRWFAEVARSAVAADGAAHNGPEPVAWEAGGLVVDDEAGVALRRELGSPLHAFSSLSDAATNPSRSLFSQAYSPLSAVVSPQKANSVGSVVGSPSSSKKPSSGKCSSAGPNSP
jgi:hypothetical protein